MTSRRVHHASAAALILGGLAIVSSAPLAGQDGFRFRSGVELINVTATVIDRTGRFVSGLHKEDFQVFEDDKPVDVTHFTAERTPVSLGIVLDTSGSMEGEKWAAARTAIDRFLSQLSDPQDEFFLYRFSANPDLMHDWTSERLSVVRSLGRVSPSGGTAMYDAMVDAVPMAQGGRNRKKAVVLISDGNDTSSQNAVSDVRQIVRETEVLVYAIGIDGRGPSTTTGPPRQPVGGRPPMPIPFPIPGGGRRRPGPGFPTPPIFPPQGGGGTYGAGGSSIDRVNAAALREITDDSGGRTEIVRYSRDLEPATAGIADELGRQYYLGYASPGHKDGRWHTIRLELRDPSLRIRARRGYVATP